MHGTILYVCKGLEYIIITATCVIQSKIWSLISVLFLYVGIDLPDIFKTSVPGILQ
jgi:hypothetical protein